MQLGIELQAVKKYSKKNATLRNVIMTDNTGKLAGKTLFITGASRGIGKEIALKAAVDGANVVVVSKTRQLNIKLPDTIYEVAREVEKAGGKSLACTVDITDDSQVQLAVERTIMRFGGIDILINNASSNLLTKAENTDMRKYDLMHNINTRGTLMVTKACLPYLKKSTYAHILNITPPLNLNPQWFALHVPYTITKYGVSMCVIGMCEEFRPFKIAVNALWPGTAVHTLEDDMQYRKEVNASLTRRPQIMADAAYCILTQEPKPTGQFFIDHEVLINAGVTDIDQYAVNSMFKNQLFTNVFVDEKPTPYLIAIDQRAKDEASTSGNSSRAARKRKQSPKGKLAAAFKAIETNLNSKLVRKTQAIYQFVLTGKKGGKWYIDLKHGSGSCGRGDPPQKADAVLTMESKSFFEMLFGNLAPTAAFVMGKLKITGDMQKALKLDDVMKEVYLKLQV